MTFKERLEIEHPESMHPVYDGMCAGCPCDYEYEVEDESPCRTMSGYTECWNREIPEEKTDNEKEKEKMMKLEDIKAGMLIVIERYGKKYNCIVDYNDRGVLGYAGGLNVWGDMSSFNENLQDKEGNKNIVAVYGRAMNYFLTSLDISNRTKLFERPLIKELTADEAAKLLKEKFPEYSEIKIVM